ncbi:LamG domain-containing protein [Carboxylicivirga sp. M1479]|uniref:LamG domain-containing protein n=1 Tax=Carboxylicivirga sp. M1479 TaxID=2594476 RepID=UPI00163DB049|nr:LamG domain-containing protein [Carboxylicivirga sp. M1479]
MRKISLNIGLLIMGLVVLFSCTEYQIPEEVLIDGDRANVVDNAVTVKGPNSIEIQYALSTTEEVDYIECTSDLGTHNISVNSTTKRYEFLDPALEYTFYLSTVYTNGVKSEAIMLSSTAGEFVPNVVTNLEAVVIDNKHIEIKYTLSDREGVDYIECKSDLGTTNISNDQTGILYQDIELSGLYNFKLTTVYLNGDRSDYRSINARVEVPIVKQILPVLHYNFENSLINDGTVGIAGNLSVASGGTATYISHGSGSAYEGTINPANHLTSTWGGITGNSERTITAWVKISNNTSIVRPIVGFGSRPKGTEANGKRYNLVISKTNQLTISIQGVGSTFTDPLIPGVWTFVAVTHDGTDYLSGSVLYVGNSNSLVGERGTDETIVINTVNNSNPENTLIGGQWKGGDLFHGTFINDGGIDDVRVYDFALTEQQLLEVMQSTAGQ